MVDSLAPNPSIAQQQQAEYNDALPAVEGVSQPAINRNDDLPSIEYGTGQYDTRDGGYIPHIPDGGTVLSDTTYMMGQNGITQVNNMSTNTTSDWEAQVRTAQRDAIQGKSRYNTPVTQTPSVAPNIEEPPKPTQEQLAQLRKRDKLLNLNNRLKTLAHDRLDQIV